MRVYMHAYALALPSYRWDSLFSCPFLLHLIFRSVVELHFRSVGTFGAQKYRKISSSAADTGCFQCIPSCEKFQLPFIQQPALPASFLASSAMQLQVINAKVFGMWKLKVWGQHKINWIAKWKSTGNSPDRIIQLHIYLIKARHSLIKTQPLQNFPVAACEVGRRRRTGFTAAAAAGGRGGPALGGGWGVPLLRWRRWGAAGGHPARVRGVWGHAPPSKAAHCPLTLLPGSGGGKPSGGSRLKGAPLGALSKAEGRKGIFSVTPVWGRSSALCLGTPRAQPWCQTCSFPSPSPWRAWCSSQGEPYRGAAVTTSVPRWLVLLFLEVNLSQNFL